MMKLEENPFYLLGVGVDSTKADITQKADDKCFDEPELEEDIEKAKGILLNPQRRIGAEIRWFPGCSGSAFQQNLAEKFQDLNIYAMGGNALCKLNILLVQLEGLKKIDDIVITILAIDDMYSKISLEDIRQWLNKDRQKAKFPEIQDVQPIEAVWKEYRQDIRQQLLDKCSSWSKMLANDTHGGDECAWEGYFMLIPLHVAEQAAAKGHFGVLLQDFITQYELVAPYDKNKWYNLLVEDLEAVVAGTEGLEELNNRLDLVICIAKPLCLMNMVMGIDEYPLAAGAYNKTKDASVELWDNGEQEKAIRVLEILVKNTKDIEPIYVRACVCLENARKNYTPSRPAGNTASTQSTSASTAKTITVDRHSVGTTSSIFTCRTATTSSGSTSVNRSGQLSPDKGSSSDSSSDLGGCCGCLGMLVIGSICASVGPVGIGIGIIVLIAIGVLCDD